MWLPNTDPSGSGLIANARFRGQEGAAANAASYKWIGVLGVTGFLMQDLEGNALDYVEGGKYNGRREDLSELLDSSNPDFSAFVRRGGKMIVAIGSNDTLASPGPSSITIRRCWTRWAAPKSIVSRASMYCPDRPRSNRYKLHHRWRRKEARSETDPQHVRPPRTAHRLGGERHRARQVGQGHRGRPQPAHVLLSRVSEVHQRCTGSSRILQCSAR